MNALEKAFSELDEAGVHWAANRGEVQALKRLTDAARTYAQACWAAKTGSKGRSDSKPTTSTMVLPFGRAKGQTIGAASTAELRFVLGVVEESIDDDSKAQYRAKNVTLKHAVRAELANRGEL